MTLEQAGPARPITGFWRRLGALLIDLLVLGLVGAVLGWLLFDTLARLGGYGRWLGFAIALSYFGVLNSRWGGGQTLGKRLFGIRVVGRDGRGLPVPRSLVRYSVLGIPFFLNGAPIAIDTLFAGWGYLISLLVFGGMASIIYLYVFNRRTRQSLHDLLLGTWVVQAEPGGEMPAAQVWRGHLIVVAALLALSATAPALGYRLAQTELFAGMLPLYERLSAQPHVRTAQVNVGTTWHSGADESSYIAAQLLLDTRATEDEALAKRMAQLILAHYPPAAKKSVISVQLVYGYDIGIASGWLSHGYRYQPDQLK